MGPEMGPEIGPSYITMVVHLVKWHMATVCMAHNNLLFPINTSIHRPGNDSFNVPSVLAVQCHHVSYRCYLTDECGRITEKLSKYQVFFVLCSLFLHPIYLFLCSLLHVENSKAAKSSASLIIHISYYSLFFPTFSLSLCAQ